MVLQCYCACFFGTSKSAGNPNQIQSLGANLLTVSPGSVAQAGVRGAAGGATTLTNDDANAIKTSSQITTIQNVSPEVSKRLQVTAGRNNSNIQVIGTTAVYADVHKVTVAQVHLLPIRIIPA